MSNKKPKWDGRSRPSDDVYRKNIPDIKLSEEQEESILSLLDGLDLKTNKTVKDGIKSMSINSMNYEATIRKLKTMKEANNGVSK